MSEASTIADRVATVAYDCCEDIVNAARDLSGQEATLFATAVGAMLLGKILACSPQFLRESTMALLTDTVAYYEDIIKRIEEVGEI